MPRAQTRPCPSASATPTTPWAPRGAPSRWTRRAPTWPSLREPLVPCVAITSPQDCIFGQSQPFLPRCSARRRRSTQLARCAYVAAHPGARGSARPSRRCTCCTCCSRPTTYGATSPPTGSRTTGRPTRPCCSTRSSRAPRMADRGHRRAATPRARRVRGAHAQQAGRGLARPSAAPLQDWSSAASSGGQRSGGRRLCARRRTSTLGHGVPAGRDLAKTNGSLDLPLADARRGVGARSTRSCARVVAARVARRHARRRRSRRRSRGCAAAVAGARGARDAHASSARRASHGAKPRDGVHRGRAAHGAAAAAALLQGASSDASVVRQLRAQLLLLDLPAVGGARHPHPEQGALLQGHLAA